MSEQLVNLIAEMQEDEALALTLRTPRRGRCAHRNPR